MSLSSHLLRLPQKSHVLRPSNSQCFTVGLLKELLSSLHRSEAIQLAYPTAAAKNMKHSKLPLKTTMLRACKDHLPLRVLQITVKRPEQRTEEEDKFAKNSLREVESSQSYS